MKNSNPASSLKSSIQEDDGKQKNLGQDSKFYNLFLKLSAEEKNYETFFHFKKEKLVEIVEAYYCDIQKSFSNNSDNILNYILNYIYNNINTNFELSSMFEGTQIGIKEEQFKIIVEKNEASLDNNLTIIKITQNLSEEKEKNKNNNEENQRFSLYIEQNDKVVEILKFFKQKINDYSGEKSIQLTAMMLILCDHISNSSHRKHHYEIVHPNGELKLHIEHNCTLFDMIPNLSINSSNKIKQ